MNRRSAAALVCVGTWAASSCATDACGCTPLMVPAMVTGRVVTDGGEAVARAQVRAYSAPAPGCNSLDDDFGLVATEADGSFRLGLASGMVRDSVCVLVFARPPQGASGLEDSDTALVVMNFGDGATLDSAAVELVLRAK